MSIVSTYLFYFIAFLFALQTSSCCVQQSSALPTEPKQDTVVFLNGGFEFVTDSITPFKWTIYDSGSFEVDSLVKFSGKYSGRLTSVDADTAKSSFVFNHIYLALLPNKTIKLKTKIKTELKDSAYTQISIIDSNNRDYCAFGKMIKGVTDWNEDTMIIKTDSVPVRIMIGISINGAGRIWVDDMELYADDELISYTPRATLLSQEEKSWLKKNTYDIFSDDFHASIGSSRIVGIGEESHGSANIRSTREEIIKDLIKNKGFTIIMEEIYDYATKDAEIVDDYILNKKNRIPVENYDLLYWIREYNKTAERKVRYFGVEAPLKSIIETIERKTKGELTEYTDTLKKIITSNFEKQHKYYDVIFTSSVRTTINRIGGIIDNWVDANIEDESEKDEFKFTVNLLLRKDDSGYKNREITMGDIIERVADKYPNEKIIFTAHNAHVGHGNSNSINRFVGNRLKNRFKDDYFTIRMTFFNGNYAAEIMEIPTNEGLIVKSLGVYNHSIDNAMIGSSEYQFNLIDKDLFYLPLRGIDRVKANNWLFQPMENLDISLLKGYYQQRTYILPNCFDGVVFIKTSTSTN